MHGVLSVSYTYLCLKYYFKTNQLSPVFYWALGQANPGKSIKCLCLIV